VIRRLGDKLGWIKSNVTCAPCVCPPKLKSIPSSAARSKVFGLWLKRMSAEEIRRYVAIANDLHGDLVALTGDFLTYDPSAEGAVVQALSALKAPFGVFGCLGNHEIYTETEDSITRLFAARGTRILRGDRAAVNEGGSVLNLIGVDMKGLMWKSDSWTIRKPSKAFGTRRSLIHCWVVSRLSRPRKINAIASKRKGV
jgi:hypothetical protein